MRRTNICIAVLLLAATAALTSSGTLLTSSRHEVPGRTQRTLTFQERVSYQRAIEEVYWRHRIWPDTNPAPKPPLDKVISQAQLEKKVESYLRNSQALAGYWQRPITSEQLQAEMDRMAQNTRQPEVLQELFEALGNDPFVIAECLARPMLAERLLAHRDFQRVKEQSRTFDQTVAAGTNYTLPTISDPSGGCIGDTWTPTNLIGAPDARLLHTAVWTGTEMIVWGGDTCDSTCTVNTGGRYNPSTDNWTATSTTNAPEDRKFHTAVWTGTEMIVWGGIEGQFPYPVLNTGGRYNPVTDDWTATSSTNAPEGRYLSTAVWTGTEMIVWGGNNDAGDLNTGGRYNPANDNWTATSTTNAPDARSSHTAVWTGSEMITWGGADNNFSYLNTGGRYDPSTDSWTATSTTNAPEGRILHTTIWTGTAMIVWGGEGGPFNTGGRYYPDIDSWASTSIIDAPPARSFHTAVWTGSEMVVWGGVSGADVLNTGGKYCVPSGPPRPCPTPRPRPTPAPRP